MHKNVKVAFFLSFFLATVILLSYRKERPHGKPRTIAYSEVRLLEEMMDLSLTEHGDMPIRSAIFNGSYDNRRLFEEVATWDRTDITVYRVINTPRWSEIRSFPDPWGNEYRIMFERVVEQTNRWRLSIVSLGPNGIDENGAGDDIKRESFWRLSEGKLWPDL